MAKPQKQIKNAMAFLVTNPNTLFGERVVQNKKRYKRKEKHKKKGNSGADFGSPNPRFSYACPPKFLD